jgi:membrane protein implicated in regulation of membrane protease activity
MNLTTKSEGYLILLALVIIADVILGMLPTGIITFVPLTYLAYLLMEKVVEEEKPKE